MRQPGSIQKIGYLSFRKGSLEQFRDSTFTETLRRNEMTMNLSPFHADELDAQARAGQCRNGASIRSFMPEQHRAFFALLPYLFVATTDASASPLATLLTRPP